MSLPPIPADAFTIAVLPDTQQYTSDNPDALHAMTRWIAEQRDAQRIVFCSHVGDVVRHFDRAKEWSVADEAMSRLDGVVPYGFSVGNNDMDETTGAADWFCRTFPLQRYAGYAWYGGQYRDNANSFQTFEAAGRRFLVLHLECNAPDDVLSWANDVLADHADHHIMATAHMFLGPLEKPAHKQGFFTDPRGVARWSKCHGSAGNSPEQLWDKCLGRHRGLFLVVCGDQSRVQAMRMELIGLHGNRVQACLCDYYGAVEGWLRLYRCTPSLGRMEVFTFGAVSGTLCVGTPLVPESNQHHFTAGITL